MPIAKLISADGSIEIYYELHGRHSTTRDDMSYSEAANESSWAGKRSSSIKEAGRKDPALARTLYAVDSAVGAQEVMDRGREEADTGRLQSGPSDAVSVPRRFLHSAAGSQIELADMSGRSSPACQGMRDSPSASASQASEAGLARKQSSGPAPDRPTAEETSAGRLKEPTSTSREASNVDGSRENAGSHSAVPNGGAGNTYVVTMPHEDLETSTSRGLEAEHPGLCSNIMFICGMSARGRTEFYQPVVEHLCSIPDAADPGRKLLTCCTFDNRGIGSSTIPEHLSAYKTGIMAADVRALMDHLGWQKAHVMGMSLGGFVGCKMVAKWPERVASLTMLSTTQCGWHMAAQMMRRPWVTLKAGSGPLESKIPANLRANFSSQYLGQKVDGRTRKEILSESTREAMRLGITEKFLAEGQPETGKNGHVLAAVSHRLSKRQVKLMRESGVPMQMINGRNDLVAGVCWVKKLAKQLKCPLILTDGAHAGICLETPEPINAAMDQIIKLQELKDARREMMV